MNNLFFKKLTFAFSLIGSMFLISCGSSGGGDEVDFEFKSSDLTNKYWYASTFIDDSYATNDVVIVYRFNSGGDLYKQEFSGRRDTEVGNWGLNSDNILTINDETLSAVQEWKIDKSSTKDQIYLKSTNGIRTFHTQISELDDVTADAFLVKNVYLKNGDFVDEYRYEFAVKGESIKSVKALVSSNDEFDLVETINSENESVWRINEVDAEKYLDAFPGERVVKFALKMDSGEEYKLEDQIYNKDISAINYQEVDTDHNTGTDRLSLNVEWEALSDEDVYYYVQILNSDKDENHPLFTSGWQPADGETLQSLLLEENTAGEFGLALGDFFYVKIVALLFEDGINPFQGDIHEFNIQAQSQFIKSGGEW
ncbi:MAG: hypothetical protein COC06_06655 [Bacteroidales bacterium]|nr:MAG: hypothetical protein COC06_06655 [Bacteroidales bacterium]